MVSSSTPLPLNLIITAPRGLCKKWQHPRARIDYDEETAYES